MRTKNSVKNILSVIIFNLIIGALGFVKVKVFVTGFSNDIYSLNQLFYQIFGYLAIADVGFGLILNQKLYKAFSKDDKNEINRIYSTSKKFYRTLGIGMMLVAFVISFFVHHLTKANISNFYIQAVFIIFVIRNTIDYFFISPRFIMESDQKNYKINHYVKSIKIIETIIEIFLVLCGANYFVVLIPGIIITIIIDVIVNRKVYKEYNWLNESYKFNKEHLKGTKDLIFIKFAGIMNSNTDIILISTFINPLSVIIYTSYNYITKFISDTIYIMANSITPSFANVICKESENKSYEVFCELNIFFLFIGSFVFIILFNFLNPLIELWLGKEYLTTSVTLALFCLICFLNISMRAVCITINSKALFNETKVATLLEAIINLIVSLTLVFRLGLIGVLLGTIISYYCTSFIQNACCIYKNVFKKNTFHYFKNYLFTIIITVGITLIISSYSFNVSSIMNCFSFNFLYLF